MSSRTKAKISKKTPAPLVEQAALAMVKQLVEQGRAKEVFREFRAHTAGKAVLKEQFPGPKNAIAVLSGFTDSSIDNTYGYLLEDDESRWLFKLLGQDSSTYDDLAPGRNHRLGGPLLHCEDQDSVIEVLTNAINNLDFDDFDAVVREGLGIQIDYDEQEEEEENEDEDGEDGDTERVFDHNDWVENHGEELGTAIIEKLNELVDDSKLASQDDVDEVMRPKIGVLVRGTIILDANSWE